MFEWLSANFHGIFTFIEEHLPFLKGIFSFPSRKKKFHVVQRHKGWWHLGSVDKKPATQLCADFCVTNTDDKPIILLTARITRFICNNEKAKWLRKIQLFFINKFRFLQKTYDGLVLYRDFYGSTYGKEPIPPSGTTDARIDFFIEPPICKEGEEIIATIILRDQYNNKYIEKNISFRPPVSKPEKEERIEQLIEPIHSLSNSLEKNVVSILQAEIFRYKQCGRRVGGLGSIQMSYNGHKFTGMGADGRKADSPEVQVFVKDPENASIISDNADALLNVYNQLTTDKEKQSFVKYLLKRLSKDTEYASIGYLILYVLMRVDKFPEALSKAKRDLQNDDKYGFSDLLIFLDRSLKYKHEMFTESMLEETEKFIDKLQEHTFCIKERVVSIRASRLALKVIAPKIPSAPVKI